MARNLSHNLKRIVAGLCAMLIVAGAVPSQPFFNFIDNSSITASAEETHTAPYVDGTTLHLAGYSWTVSDVTNVLTNAGVAKTAITRVVADEGTVFPEDCSNLFASYSNLTNVDLSNANTSKVKVFSSMFYGCKKITGTLDLSYLDTSSATSMIHMFNNVKATTIDISSFSTPANIGGMFDGCSNLVTIYAGKKWDNSKITETNDATVVFSKCSNLVGGNGTKYDKTTNNTKSFAKIDVEGDIGLLTLGHAYNNEPTWTWSDDYSSCDATFVCDDGDKTISSKDENSIVHVKVGEPVTDTEAGTITYTATAKIDDKVKMYTTTKIVKTATDISTLEIADIADQPYTGSAIMPSLTITDSEKTLKAGTDYTVEYTDNINAGTATATITGIGGYTGTATKTFKIIAPTITLTSDTLTYTDGLQQIIKSVEYSGDNSKLWLCVKRDDDTSDTYNWYQNNEYYDYTVTPFAQINAGIYNVYYYIGVNAPANTTSHTAQVTGSVTIDKATNEFTTTPIAKTTLIYDGMTQELLSQVPVAKFGYIQYKVDEGEWSDDVPKASSAGSHIVYYKVEGTDNYTGLSSQVSVSIGYGKLTGVSAENYSGNYDGNAHSITVTAPEDATITYCATENGIYTADPITFKNATDGAQTVYYKVEAANYEPFTGSATVTINKEDPSYETPTGLTAIYGQTLAAVNLPTGWTWEDSTQSVGNVGTNTFKAKFTPSDTANYNTVEGVEVEVKVGKATPDVTAPTGLTAIYGQTLKDVDLPQEENGKWEWVDDSTDVGDAGENKFSATYTPADTDNYNIVTKDVTVTVGQAENVLTVSIDDRTYGDTPKDPTVEGAYTAGVTYQYAKQGTKDWSGTIPTDAGEYTVKATVPASQNYKEAAAEKNFTIAKKSIEKAVVTLDSYSFDVSDTPCKPTVNFVIIGRSILTAGTDYTVSYKNNEGVSDKTPTVVIEGTGNYTGTCEVTFTIGTDLSGAAVTVEGTFTYDGTAKTPDVTVTYNGSEINADNYDITYTNNTNAGTAMVTIKGKSEKGYTGTASTTFTIAKAEIKTVVVDGEHTYSGAAIEPTLSVKDENDNTVDGSNYDVTFVNNTNAGTATVVVTAKDSTNYTGTKIGTFTIGHKYDPVSEVPASCTATGLKAHYVDENGVIYTKNDNGEYVKTEHSALVIDKTPHSYGEPEWIWSKTDDGYKAYAKFNCTNCNDNKTLEATVTGETVTDGVLYKATVTDPNGNTATDTKLEKTTRFTVQVNGGGIDTADGETSAEYDVNSIAIIEAAPEKDGKYFEGWYVNGVLQSRSNRYSFFVSGNVTVVASYSDAEQTNGDEAVVSSNYTRVSNSDERDTITVVGDFTVDSRNYAICEAGFIVKKGNETTFVKDGEGVHTFSDTDINYYTYKYTLDLNVRNDATWTVIPYYITYEWRNADSEKTIHYGAAATIAPNA